MYTALCSSLLFPLHERLKGHHSVALHRELEASQWWPAERLLAAAGASGCVISCGRSGATSRTTAICSRSVGFDPASVRVRRRPAGTAVPRQADDPRQHGDRLKSERAGKLIRYNTGGSSGEPLVFYMGMGRVSHDVAAKWRATRWWDVDIGDVEVVLWGSPIEIGKQDRIKAVRDRLFRSHLLPAFQMSDPQMDRYLDEIARLRPEDAVRLCVGAGAAGRACRAPRPRHARTAGHESRSRPARPCTRRSARSSSACSAPRSPMATDRAMQASSRTSARRARCTCRRSTSSSNWWTTNGQPGGAGRAGRDRRRRTSATGDFPFIRYRTGDMAVMGHGAMRVRTRPAGPARSVRAIDGLRAHARPAMRCTRWR